MTARNLVILVSVVGSVGLGACAGLGPHAQTAAAPAPRPAEGLWAILDPGCGKPNLADPRKWPTCASPFWISRNSAVIVRSTPTTDAAGAQASYRAGYRLAAGDPVIAKIGNRKDGYLFLALTDLGRDAQGRLVAATGAAFACAGAAGPQVTAEPVKNGCAGQPSAVLRRAAQETLKDPSALSRVAWIAAGAPAPQ